MKLTIHLADTGKYELGPGYLERIITVDRDTYEEVSNLWDMHERLSDLLETLYKEAVV